MENKKEINILIIVLVIFAISSISIGLFYGSQEKSNNKGVYNKQNSKKKNNNITSNEYGNDKNTNKENKFLDYNSIQTELLEELNNSNTEVYLKTCVDDGTRSETGEPNWQITSNTLSNESIISVIEKLKEADQMEEGITSSFFCLPYTYSITSDINTEAVKNIFTLNYGDEDDTLLVGVRDKSYAFHYNDSSKVLNFIENLK